MAKYRKRPIEVSAWQYRDSDDCREALRNLGVLLNQHPHEASIGIWNITEECWVRCPPGHWVIRGVAGEFYPCEPEVFAATYESVEETA